MMSPQGSLVCRCYHFKLSVLRVRGLGFNSGMMSPQGSLVCRCYHFKLSVLRVRGLGFKGLGVYWFRV